MTKFTKEGFTNSGGFIGYEGKFVARFKYARSGVASFISFLVKNFTTEEYFTALDAGTAPLTILETKGYILPHIKKELARQGYEVSQAGFKQMIADQVAKYYTKAV